MLSKIFELDRVVFFGRTGSDYLEMFDLDLPALRGRDVLDCPAGPDAFVADATAAGVRAVGCDPVYELQADEILARGRKDIEDCMVAMRRSDTFPTLDFDKYEASKIEALDRFHADFTGEGGAARYRAGALPALPFADASFDLVLSAHLIFTYSDPASGGLLPNSPFDLAWHRAAIAELLRVTRGEVRLYPTTTVTADAQVHPYVEPLMASLHQDAGLETTYEPSRFDQGLSGPNRYLRIRRRNGTIL